ncbi:hypothetical protein EVAR_40946_1 [Eumeta japonica]|uniref:Uncharacterized protein n=1 Tax=Eumeta variegata TaxID=151549 RepID=A0A4C1X7Z3_EUMVA|nr:hypothetical protein EVAR_40946_1 [Eumeta japonica]
MSESTVIDKLQPARGGAEGAPPHSASAPSPEVVVVGAVPLVTQLNRRLPHTHRETRSLPVSESRPRRPRATRPKLPPRPRVANRKADDARRPAPAPAPVSCVLTVRRARARRGPLPDFVALPCL